jgi:daunorubicin resistance ABC transporter ATP-binding subunit
VTIAIEVEGLHKTFGGKRSVVALDGVSFAAEGGQVFGLLGPNGAGKTTVVRILTTILRPDSGRALVLGHDSGREAALVRSIIGLAGQYAAVDQNLTGQENLVMVARLNHMAKAVARSRARELLDQFGLADAADRPLKTYSGGMRRRLDLAAALVAEPPVLFLDEPTTGLDPQSRNGLWEVIESLVADGTTVLLTTQYLEEADRLASHLVVVDHGRVIADGTPAELKAQLGATILAIEFRRSELAVQAADRLSSLDHLLPRVVGSLLEIPVSDGPAVAVEVLRQLDAGGLTPAGFTLREPSLDDVFLSLTGRPAEEAVAEAQPQRSVAR